MHCKIVTILGLGLGDTLWCLSQIIMNLMSQYWTTFLLNSSRLWSCKILQKSNLHSHDKSSLWSSYVIIWQFTLQLLCYQNFRTSKLFKEVLQNEQNKLHELLSARNTCTLNLRNMRKFKPVFKTNRFRNSFITFNSLGLKDVCRFLKSLRYTFLEHIVSLFAVLNYL